MKLLSTLILFFALPAFAGPSVSGGPANGGILLNCTGNSDSNLNLKGPNGQSAFYAYAAISLRAYLVCSGASRFPVNCRTSVGDPKPLQIVISRDASGLTAAYVYGIVNGRVTQIDLMVCR
jgi:hypothetical protein